MMLIVPVGATVVVAALRIGRLYFVSQMLPFQLGKQPRSAGELLAAVVGLVVDELHEALAPGDALLAVVLRRPA